MENTHDLAKLAELEDLLNRCMRATFKWEQAGEKSYGEEMLGAATTIRNHTPKIVRLYADLLKSRHTSALYIKNKVLPAPMPSEINAQMAIMGVFQFASALESKNSSFNGQLIDNDTKNKLTRIIAGYTPLAEKQGQPTNLWESSSKEVDSASGYNVFSEGYGYYWRASLIGTLIILGGTFGIIFGLMPIFEFALIVNDTKLGAILVFLFAILWMIVGIFVLARHLRKKGY